MKFIDLGAQQDRIRPQVDEAVAAVLDHGRYIMGPEVAELEARLGGFVGVGESVSCASGTDALVMALMVRGIGPGDAVFVPSFTFAATAEAVALLGATPVFVDIDESSYNLDAASLDAAVRGLDAGLVPVGVVPVDLFGLPADHDAIAAVCEAHGLWIVADGAQSFGAERGGRRVGALAPLTTTSFFPAKPLGCYGDGGAVHALDPDDAAVLRSIRVHGSGTEKYDNVRLGINGRLDTIQAAILLQKLAIFDDELARRRRVADRYLDALPAEAGRPVAPEGVSSAWAQFTIRVPDRDVVAKSLADAGVPTAVYYPLPLHRQRAYERHPVGAGGLAVSDRASLEVLSLPMHPYLGANDQDRIVEVLCEALGVRR